MIAGLLLAAWLAIAPPAGAPAPAGANAAAARAADWVRHVERTPEGGYRMGDPAAPLKLVEYGSATCPHCAEFAQMADRPLRTRFVATGRVSFEYRPFTIFPSDPGLFVLAECQGPQKFFATLDRLYATQDAWRARMDAQEATWRTLLGPALAQAMVQAGGVAGLYALTPQRVRTCLADPAAYARLRTQSIAAERLGVEGTPTFFLNGRMIEFESWADLERILSAG